MKRKIYMTALLAGILLFNKSNAQEKENEIEKNKYELTAGVMVTPFFSFPKMAISSHAKEQTEEIEDKTAMFKLGILPSLNLSTPFSHHHVMYDLFNREIQTLHGVKVLKTMGITTLFSRNLKEKENYLSFGIEKIFRRKKSELTVFVEIGTVFRGNWIPGFGITFNPQTRNFLSRK